MHLYFYKAFGLTIRSDKALQEMFAASVHDHYDIDLRHGVIPPRPDDDRLNLVREHLRIGINYFWLHVEEVATYEVVKTDDQTCITIEAIGQASWTMIKSWLLGSALTAALQMNNRFAIHASSVVYENQVVLFAGHSGRGKSTLATQLVERGFFFYSDDKCVALMDESSNQYYTEPSLRLIRLWQKSEYALKDISRFHNKSQVARGADKYQYIISADHQVVTQHRLSKMYILGPWIKKRNIEAFDLSGLTKVKALARHTHRHAYIKALKKQGEHWNHISRLANQISVTVLMRSNEVAISDFADFVADKIRSDND